MFTVRLDENNKSVRGKCIVCCQCTSTPDFHLRENKSGKRCNRGRDGYKVATVCSMCSKDAESKFGQAGNGMKLFQPIHLCTKARFTHHGVQETCFELHHSKAFYPDVLNCASTAKTGLSFPQLQRASQQDNLLTPK